MAGIISILGIITGGMTPTARAADYSLPRVETHCEMSSMVSFLLLLTALALCVKGICSVYTKHLCSHVYGEK